jgi:hypothetical protein
MQTVVQKAVQRVAMGCKEEEEVKMEGDGEIWSKRMFS